MPKVLSRLALVSAASLSAAAPVSVSVERGLHESTLQCQDGTCCFEAGSTCIVGQWQRPDKYYKPSGSCQTNQT